MNFGKLPPEELDSVDFTLPPDAKRNGPTLAGVKIVQESRIYTGCAKWGRREWVGNFYPAKTPERDYLSQYVEHFNSVELNAMHYKLYDPSTVAGWSEKAAGKDFRFCPKMVRTVTHFSTLVSQKAFDVTSEFLTSVMAFGDHLGPVFIQMSDRYSPNRRENLFAYLHTLPKDVSFFLEVRHPEWFADAGIRNSLFDTLSETGIGAVITDTAGRRDCLHMELTVPKAFIRFGGNDLHASDYTRLDAWVRRIKKWEKSGLQDTYFFMHQHDERNTPVLCDYLLKKLKR